jgi:integrase/recombinase XerD
MFLVLAHIKAKHITFHCSRHTFAINSLILGIPLEVVSKILGHTELKTTQIYAKVVDNLVNREMKKWNNISFPSK